MTHAVTHAVPLGDVGSMLLWSAAASGEAVFGGVSEQDIQDVAAVLPKVVRYPAVSEQAEVVTERAVGNAVRAAVVSSKELRDVAL